MTEPTERSLRWRVLSDPGNASGVRERTESFLLSAGFEEDVVQDLVLAVNEAFANTIAHAYGGRADGEIDIRLEDLPDRIEIRLRDYGTKSEACDLKPRDLEDVRPGGLGIHFMQLAADEVRFDTSLEIGTEVLMIKHKSTEAAR